MKRVIGILGLAAIAVLVLIASAVGIYGGGKQPTLAKAYWPEKEGVAHARGGEEAVRDSCVEPHPFDLPTRSPRPC